ncbi:MAG TPA: hypothetical protein VGV37_24360 [Aliidongia sp.]|uniref:hypothetical protein n=1 Tax=Aliidongia sp. TaxID=1914230 RepID=UPI002DDCC47C|nr:hypothetical protein [Aliidongia sp.]HEV2677686.1 hypothetical protein [Aliidongia sp.]
MPRNYAARVIFNVIEGNSGAETNAGEDLHDKFVTDPTNLLSNGYDYSANGLARNELLQINTKTPTSLGDAQENKATILGAIGNVTLLPDNSLLYIIGHCDPDTRRFGGGLEVEDWAEIIAGCDALRPVSRIHLVGCHSGGQAASAVAVHAKGTLSYSVTGWFSFAGRLHDALGSRHMYTQVAAYCSYVKIHSNGDIRAGFDERGARTRQAESTKVVYSWDADRKSRNMTFPY